MISLYAGETTIMPILGRLGTTFRICKIQLQERRVKW